MAKSSKEDAKKLIAEIEDIDRKLEELYAVLKAVSFCLKKIDLFCLNIF